MHKRPISRFPPVSDAPLTPRRDRDSPLMGLLKGRIPSDSALSWATELQNLPFFSRLAYQGTSKAEPHRVERSRKSIFRGSVQQTPSPCGRFPAVRPQSGKILAGQMIQDLLDHAQRHSGFASFRWRGKSQSLHCLRWRVFDARDDRDRSSALRAGLDVHSEHTLKALRPAHRRASLGRCEIFHRLRPLRLATSPSTGRCDSDAVRAIGCKYPVETGEIEARRGSNKSR